MAEYIERAAAIDLITRRYENPEICTQEINDIPVADVAPVAHGRWEYTPETINVLSQTRCSSCGWWTLDPSVDGVYHYCPNCGARMDGGDSDAFPEVVTRCKNCKHSTLPAEITQRYGNPGTLTCHNRHSPCNRRNVGENDFCSYGEPKEGEHA